MKNLYWIIILLFIFLCILHSLKYTNDPLESNINVEIIKALKDSINVRYKIGDNNSFIEILEGGSILSEKHIQQQIRINQNFNSAFVSYWSPNREKPVIASAFGTDYLHHFVNNYLCLD